MYKYKSPCLTAGQTWKSNNKYCTFFFVLLFVKKIIVLCGTARHLCFFCFFFKLPRYSHLGSPSMWTSHHTHGDADEWLAVPLKVCFIIQLLPMRRSATGELHPDVVSKFIKALENLIEHFSGVGGRHTEASPGLCNGCSWETYNYNTNLPLQHGPWELPNFPR